MTQTKAQLILFILAQESNAFTEDDLQSMETGFLEKLKNGFLLVQAERQAEIQAAYARSQSQVSMYVSLPNPSKRTHSLPDPWGLNKRRNEH